MHVLPPVPTDKLTIETSSEFRPKHTGEVPKETYALVTKGMTNGFGGGGSVDRKEKINREKTLRKPAGQKPSLDCRVKAFQTRKQIVIWLLSIIPFQKATRPRYGMYVILILM